MKTHLLIPVLFPTFFALACSDAASSNTAPTPTPEVDAAVPAPEVDAGTQGDASEKEEKEEDIERFLVADAENANVSVFDSLRGTLLGTFPVVGAGRVYTGPTGRYAYVVQGTQNMVHVVDMGIEEEDHGAHAHYHTKAPKLHAATMAGNLPIHFVGHDDMVTVFFDNDGVAKVWNERDLDKGTPAMTSIDTGMPHHGVALTFGGKVLATKPVLAEGATRATPQAISTFAMTGAFDAMVTDPCPVTHGEAAKSGVVVFGCADGVLVVTKSGGAITSGKIANPMGATARVGTVVEHPSRRTFVGNFGTAQMVSIDAAAMTMTPFDAPAGGVMQFGFDHEGMLVVLTKDGKIHTLDANGVVTASLQVTSPATDDSGHGAKYPAFAPSLVGVLVTDPTTGKVHRVKTSPLSIDRSFALPGKPTKIASSVFEAHEH